MSPTPEEQKAIRLCIRDLRSPDAAIRERGRADAVMLGELVVPALIKMIKAGGPEESQNFCKCLVEIGEPALKGVRPLLWSSRHHEKETALQILCGLQVEEAIEELRQTLQKRAKRKWNRRGVPMYTIVIMYCVIIGIGIAEVVRYFFDVSIYRFLIIGVHLILYVTERPFACLDPNLDLFLEGATPRHLNILIMLATDSHYQSSKSARNRLSTLLDQLEPPHVLALEDFPLNLMLNHLWEGEAANQLRMMDTLARAGDARCIPYLKKIIDGRMYTKQPELRERARIALESIRARVETSSMLLRPAEAPQELLRPVMLESELLLGPMAGVNQADPETK